MEWFRWFGRWGERDEAVERLKALRQSYGGHGDRVIRLSARTDIARKSAGSTQRAFEFVENAFVMATQEYARIGELIESIEASLAKGRLGNFAAVDTALKGLGPKLDELERNLAQWESRWQQVPLEIDEAARGLATLREQIEAASAQVGAPLPLTDRLAAMAQHLERSRQVLAGGNPVEASHLTADLRMAMEKVAGEAGQYVSGAGAIAQAEGDTAEARERITAAAAPAEAIAAVAAAEALLPRLRPALAAGKLDQFQADLLHIQKQLAAARAAR
jgi:chromosome segregation ATPase